MIVNFGILDGSVAMANTVNTLDEEINRVVPDGHGNVSTIRRRPEDGDWRKIIKGYDPLVEEFFTEYYDAYFDPRGGV